MAAGLALVALPVLIHLINMMRHKRVKWAAMEFLLKSHKKHRSWVWLKQLFLLLARMAAIALVVLMLAGFGCQSQLTELIDGAVTRHYIMLDDSYSMADTAGGASAFDRAQQAIERIAKRAAAESGRHEITIVRFSRAAMLAPEEQESADGETETETPVATETATDAVRSAEADLSRTADLSFVVAGDPFLTEWNAVRESLAPSQRAVGPLAALKLVRSLLSERKDENNAAYLVSDFREKEWENATEVTDLMEKIGTQCREFQIVRCVDADRSNLAITEIQPDNATQAAGVPLYINVKVHNFGKTPASKTQLTVRTSFYDPAQERSGDPDQVEPPEDDSPVVVLIPEIGPGESVTSRVQVSFPRSGQHVVEATIPEDAVTHDNTRRCVIDFLDAVPVLIVDGDPDLQNSYYLSSIFKPSTVSVEDFGGRARTGIAAQTETTAYLRDASPEVLSKYHVIYIANVQRLDERAVNNLIGFVENGGGLAWFAGDRMNYSFYTELAEKGLYPLPIAETYDLEESAEDVPDLDPIDHVVMKGLTRDRNSPARYVKLFKYVTPAPSWRLDPESTVTVAARTRTGDPLVVEKTLGDGKVVAVLTSASPTWNDLAKGPSLVVMALNIQSFLASGKRTRDPLYVGSPLKVELDSQTQRKDLAFVAPDRSGQRLVIEKAAVPVGGQSRVMVAAIGDVDLKASVIEGETELAGVYEAWPISNEGDVSVRRYVMNVDPAEGDLATIDIDALNRQIKPTGATLLAWDQLSEEPLSGAGSNLAQFILILLIILLVIEQLLAYSASYHPARGGASA